MQTELSSNLCPQKSNGGDLFMSKLMYYNVEFYKRAPNTVLRKGNYSFWLDQIE